MLDAQTLFPLVFVSVLLFDFTNGFHDTADMIATSIAAHTIRPSVAIFVVALFTFMGPIVAGTAVADTVGTFVEIGTAKNIIAESVVTGALLAAISFNLTTWFFGLPSSTSNSLAGGLAGAGLMGVGSEHINWGVEALTNGKLEGLMKVAAGLLVSPVFAFITGFIVLKLLLYIFRDFTIKVRPLFVLSQYAGIAWLGFTHGANDAQKGMAIVGMMLLAVGKTHSFEIPMWVILSCTSAITLGTILGGWSIIKTLGFKIYKIHIVDSVANIMSAALVNTLATLIGAPTSTTQVVTSSLLGNGAARNPRRTQWRVAGNIVGAWFLNIPTSMALGALYTYLVLKVL
jgi:PiT family inorganic phosphate transporter